MITCIPEHSGRDQHSKLGYATRNTNDENARIKYEKKDAKKYAKLKQAIRREELCLDSTLNYSPTAIHPRHAPWNSMCASTEVSTCHQYHTSGVIYYSPRSSHSNKLSKKGAKYNYVERNG